MSTGEEDFSDKVRLPGQAVDEHLKKFGHLPNYSECDGIGTCLKAHPELNQTPPPQTEPKNAPKDVSRLARRSAKADKPTIAQAEQKIEEQIKNLVLDLSGDWNQYEDEYYNIYQHPPSWPSFCQHKKVKDRLKKIDQLLTTSNIELLERVQMRLMSVGIGENALSAFIEAELAKLRGQG